MLELVLILLKERQEKRRGYSNSDSAGGKRGLVVSGVISSKDDILRRLLEIYSFYGQLTKILYYNF